MTENDSNKSPSLPRGAVIGILGGGQLGRMISMDAARLGYLSHIYTSNSGSSGTQVSTNQTAANYEDEEALQAFIDAVDVVTVETEHIPAETLRRIERGTQLCPSAKVVEICQNRIMEKSFINDAGVATTRWEKVTKPSTLPDAAKAFGLPCIVKTATGGYDGHGQRLLETLEDVREAASEFGTQALILEEIVDFEFEASVIVARNRQGETVSYSTVENEHQNHILWQTHAPANISPIIDQTCRQAASDLADAMDVVGLLAVEFFIGQEDAVFVNELAPRPHNSGHWSMDGAYTPQFEQLVRAISGLPLGSTDIICPTRMTNLLGDDIYAREQWCSHKNARLHLYGKDEVRKGRKMGHINELFPRGKS